MMKLGRISMIVLACACGSSSSPASFVDLTTAVRAVCGISRDGLPTDPAGKQREMSRRLDDVLHRYPNKDVIDYYARRGNMNPSEADAELRKLVDRAGIVDCWLVRPASVPAT